MPSEKVTQCVNALIARKLKIAFAESASAGKLSFEFSRVIDSGQILLGGLVCYDQCVKEDLLHVSHKLIEKHTAESAEVTKAMAQNLSKVLNADISVALTGLTSPGGSETPEKPVGTIFIHVVSGSHDFGRRYEFEGSPDAILEQATDAVSDMILTTLNPTNETRTYKRF